jgi:beta-mannosidase
MTVARSRSRHLHFTMSTTHTTLLTTTRGWDWGPLLMTSGPWQPVRLETFHVRIASVRVDYDLSNTLDKVTGQITVDTRGTSAVKLNVSISHDDHLVYEQTVSSAVGGVTVVDFELSEPKLWFPHGYGDQPLYTCTARLTTDEWVLDTCSKTIGFRRGELIQNPDEVGKTFYFRINGVDIFCGGSCWIPADSFTPRITKEKYRSWLQTIIDGYQVMIRFVSVYP